MPGLAAWLPPPLEVITEAGVQLGACTAEILRHSRRNEITACPGGTDADRRAIRDRSRDARPTGARASAVQPPAGRDDEWMVASTRIVSGQTKRNQLHSHVAAVELEGGKRQYQS